MLVVLALASACIASVHDGDTLRLCSGERVRIANIDAPEMPDSPKCHDHRKSYAWCDFRLASLSRDTLSRFMATGQIYIYRQGTDRYGRTLARVTVNGQDVGAYLIRRGLARAWR